MRSKTSRKSYRILSREIWNEIRRQYIAGCRQAEICRKFGISRSTLTSRRANEGWDAKRKEFQQNKADLLSIGRTTEISAGPVLGAQQSNNPVPRGHAEEPLCTRPPAGSRGDVRNHAADTASTGGDALQTAYREFSGVLRHWIGQMVNDEVVGSAAGIRPSRIVLDAVRALERLQRAERAALGIDTYSRPAVNNVIIVVPPKLSIEEWQVEARDNRIRHVKGEIP